VVAVANQVGRALRDARSELWGGAATFSGAIVTVLESTNWVARLLPAPLRASDTSAWRWTGCGPNEHPVVFLVGEMTAGGAHWVGFEFPSGMRYREMAVMIPFVEHVSWPKPLVFSFQMLADDVRPVVLGNSFYGFRKELASVEWKSDRYRARRDARIVFDCSGALTDPWSPICVRDDGMAWLRATFALPILGLRGSHSYISSHFDWDVDCAEACALEAQGSWHAPGAPRPIPWRSVAGRSFAVRNIRWRTGVPRPLPPT
jgi:hypothetical protein